jgi:hypothetical protein
MKALQKTSALFLLSLVIGSSQAQAQAQPLRRPVRMPAQVGPTSSAASPSASGAASNNSSRNSDYLIDQGIGKLLVSVDYNSWFEKLIVAPVSGAKQESQALYYGYGLNFEKNWYQPTWGWGIGGGLMTGRAIGGDKSGVQTYFEPRVAWYAVRAVPRIFYRWNPQADFGMDLVGMYKQAKWPDASGDLIVKSGSDILAGVFFDVRVRFNLKMEAIQSVGVLYKDESTYWRLGLGYRL